MLNFNFLPFPVLQTDRLILDRAVDSDAMELYLLRSNDAVMKYVERPRPADEHDARELNRSMNEKINQHEAVAWAIRLKGNPKLIGVIGYWRTKPEHHRAEVGYMLMPEYWAQGYTYEALMAVLDYGFNTMNLHSIEADINPDNVASGNLLRKCGFQSEAYFRENFFWKDRYYDSEIFGLLAREFKKH